MTIDDELICELLKLDQSRKVGEKALILKIFGSKKIEYKLEELVRGTEHYYRDGLIQHGWTEEYVKMTPDIVVCLPEEYKEVALEVENDISWDFQKSLRQVKKYKFKYKDTRVIIPEEYKRFAPLYKNEGFLVYLWKAKRKWQCLRCGTITPKQGPITPKCKNVDCNNKSRDQFILVGLKDADIEEYE